MDGPVWIISGENRQPWLLRRTQRAFPEAQVASTGVWKAGWYVESGAWIPKEDGFIPAVDEPLVLIGATLALHRPDEEWNEVLTANGGLFRPGDSLPHIRSLWLNHAAARKLHGGTLNDIADVALRHGWRVIRHASLDVGFDPRPCVLQVITSLQRGGAERLVLDLNQGLPHAGVRSQLLTLGSPTRAPFATPVGAVQLRLPPDPELRAREITRIANQSGADAIQAHLIDGVTLSLLGHDLPLAVTFHNQRQGWPEGIQELQHMPDALLIGCSQAVTREIEAAFPDHVARTIWNGIQQGLVAPRPLRRPGDAHSLTLVAVANPRPQKRLPVLIEVLAELPGAKLKIAGEPSSIHADAQSEVDLCRERIRRHGLESQVEWLGAVEDVPALLAQADVFVSTSSHEGLSLAQLEALHAGVPVVASDVGGAAEVAAKHPGMMNVLPVDAPPASYAAAIRDLAAKRGTSVLVADFTSRVMIGRHAWLLRALFCGSSEPKRGLLLITNNLSTGGAQSSARRLLVKLHEMGEHVRAVVLQENPGDPTPGRTALIESGVPVMALQPGDAMRALVLLLEDMAVDPPAAVLFWNVIPEFKLLLAEVLHKTRVLDVSPGEMFFASLERYFANPRPGLPIVDAVAYGRHLAGVIVKHAEEVRIAERVFRRPVWLIPNGVSPRQPKPEAAEARWVIGSAARIHRHKRLEDLVDAFRIVHAQCPQVRLRMAGAADAGQEEYARALVRRAEGLPVEWCGKVTDLAGFHDSLCVFAMISEPAGCPNASLEAMASSLPVVATAVGGAMQQVEDGLTGILTPARDVKAMAGAILRLLADDELRARMRQAALERLNNVFGLDAMAKGYLCCVR